MNDTNPISETANTPVHPGWMWPGLLALLVWLVSLAVTGVLWHQAREDAHRALRSDFERQATDITKEVQRHLNISALILKSFTGLFNASDKVTRQDFHAYYKTLNLATDVHGFTGMSYESRIAAQDLNQYFAQSVNLALDVHGFAAVTYMKQVVAKDMTSHVNAMRKMGYANYRISPPGTRAVYAPIVFIEPMTDSNLLLPGFDPYTVLPARTAMNQARDSGAVALSAKLTHLSDVGTPISIPDFVMYAPIYRSGEQVDTPERRRSHFLGWVDVLFRMTEFMAYVFPDGISPLDLEIFDGSTPSLDSLMFDSDSTLRFALGTESPFRYVQSLDFGGRTWTLVFHAKPGFGAGAVTQKPQLMAITGILLGTLLALLTAMTINAQRRRQMRVLQNIAIQQAQERDALRTQSEKALKESVLAMNEAQRIARVGTYITDIKTGLWQSSAILDDIFGIDNTFIKTIDNWNALVDPEDRQALLDDNNQVIESGGKFKHDYQVIRPCDGQRRWVTALGEFTYDTEGKPAILRGTIQDITQRKLSELELQKHRDHLATLVREKTAKLQNSMDSTQHALAELEQQKQVLDHHAIVTITDPEGYIIYGNDKFTEISGYSPNEFLGKTHDLVHSGYHPHGFFKTMFDTISRGEVWRATVCNRAKDGHLFWVDTTVLAFRNTEGQPVKYIAVRTDVTARKQMEEALHHNQLRYQSLINSMNDVMFTLTTEGVCEFVSPQWTTNYGHNADEVIGQHFSHFVHPDDIARCMAFMQLILETDTGQSGIEYRVQCKDGTYQWNCANGSVMKDESTGVVLLVGIGRNISQNKRDQEAQLYSISLLQAVIESTDYGILVVDGNRHFTRYNQRFIDLWKIPQELLEPLDSDALRRFAAAQMMHPDAHLASIHAKYDDPDATSNDILELADGRIFRQISHPQKNGNAVVGRVWSFDDITDIKRAEHAALAANRAKSEFLANMSHEIRTPMNGVIGMIDILQHSELNEEQRRMLNTIHQSSLALLRILNDILDYSKIEAGKLDVENIPTPLRHLIDGVAQLMTTSAKAKSIDMSVWIDPVLPEWVYSDPARLRQVLLNLTGNAIKFTPSRPDHSACIILVAARVPLPEGQYGLLLRVVDNGIGMSEDVLARLFQPFTQADSSTSRQFGGTGLGLSICQRLITLMGGHITVQSVLNQGSEFTVSLPLHEAPPGQLPTTPYECRLSPRTHLHNVDVHSVVSNGPLILLAEDNETNRDILCEQLRLLGYRTDVAIDGAMALEKWRAGQYALLLTDCHMPKMDGFALTAAIREAEPSGTHLPVIAVTANAMQGEAQRCLDSGMDDYLSKPLRMETLGPMLRKWLVPVPTLLRTNADSLPFWDANTLGELVGNNTEMHQRLLGKFLVKARLQITEILAATQNSDTPSLTSLAHTLKSAARTVGALALGELCQHIEQAGHKGDAKTCQTLVQGLEDAFASAASMIEAACGHHS